MSMGGPERGQLSRNRAQYRAAALAERYAGRDGRALLEPIVRREFLGRIALVSSFGADSAVLLDMVARIDPATAVIFLDTGKHFPETLAHRDALVARLGLTDVRVVAPAPPELAAEDPDGVLWNSDPDRCCRLRKVLPLERALAGFDAWITGRKRFQGGERADLPTIEAVDGRIKINPLASWSEARLWAEHESRRLPSHPLVAEGYASIGCATCTRPAHAAEGARAGRWAGSAKTECGIHRAAWARA